MSNPIRESVTVTTATGGGATGYTGPVRGYISMVKYTAAATGSTFASGVDFTITTEDSGQTVWAESNVTASKTIYPLTPGDLTTGVESSLAEVPIIAADERVKIVVAQGGNTKSGTFDVVVV